MALSNPETCSAPRCRHKRPPARHHNRFCSRCKMRDWRERNPLKAAYAHLRECARQRVKDFEISLSEFADFCERTAYLSFRGPHGWEAHVDRIDPDIGYRADNIQLLTCSENVAKQHRELRGRMRRGCTPVLAENPF